MKTPSSTVLPRRRVLLVCAGNICRSPMAEALLRDAVARRPALGRLEIASAGIIATPGQPPTPAAVEALRREVGLDISAHRARRLTPPVDADLILTMDRGVTEVVRALGLDGRVELLGDFAGSPGEEVADPYLGSDEEYRETVRQLHRLIDAAAQRLADELTPSAGSSAEAADREG